MLVFEWGIDADGANAYDHESEFAFWCEGMSVLEDLRAATSNSAAEPTFRGGMTRLRQIPCMRLLFARLEQGCSKAGRLKDRDIAAVSWETTPELTKGADSAERTIETCHR